MKNRFFIILLIFVSVGLISSCSSDDDVAATTTAAEAASAGGTTVGLTDAGGIATTWRYACNNWGVGNGSDQGEMVFEGATVTYNWAMYTGDNCTGTRRHDNDSYTMVPSTVATTVTNMTDNSSVSAYKNVFTVVDMFRAFDNQTDLDTANTDNSSDGCGLTDWTLNTSKSVAGLACDNTDSTEKQMAIGDALYTMFYINGTSLQFMTSLGDNITEVGSQIYTKQ